jgi:hypothetical protein
MLAIPAARCGVHARQSAIDDAFDREQQRIEQNSRELERKVNSFAEHFLSVQKRFPNIAEVEKQFNAGKPLPASSRLPSAVELSDNQQHAFVTIFVPHGVYEFAGSNYQWSPRPNGIEIPAVAGAIWSSRIGDLLLLVTFIWMWMNHSTLSKSRTVWWGWRMAGLSLIVLNLAICAAWRSSTFQLGVAIDSICFEPLVPMLILLLLPMLCLRDFPLDLARRCATCDYNLKGNQSGICPECGTPVPDRGVRKAKPSADRR